MINLCSHIDSYLDHCKYTTVYKHALKPRKVPGRIAYALQISLSILHDIRLIFVPFLRFQP